MSAQRITVKCEGRVQGVGFRHTVVNLGKALGLAGWVRNEGAGSVTLTAEGPDARLLELMQTAGMVNDHAADCFRYR